MIAVAVVVHVTSAWRRVAGQGGTRTARSRVQSRRVILGACSLTRHRLLLRGRGVWPGALEGKKKNARSV